MSDFGDATPEDAWDRGDAVPVLLDNIARRLDLLDRRTGDADTRHAFVRLLAERVDSVTVRRDTLSDAERLRLELVVVDLEYVRGLVNG